MSKERDSVHGIEADALACALPLGRSKYEQEELSYRVRAQGHRSGQRVHPDRTTQPLV